MNFKPKNSDSTSVGEIVEQLQEKRPLPLGRKEFNDFYERIWSGALITPEPGQEDLLRLSVKALLADEVVHLPGGQTHESDIYFINRARKLCANQVAMTLKEEARKEMMDILSKRKEEIANTHNESGAV